MSSTLRWAVRSTKSTAPRSPDFMAADGQVPFGPLSFHYHRGIAPMMWVLIGLSGIELFVIHFLLAFWSSSVALAASVLTLGTMLWLVGLVRSMKRLPVVLDGDDLVMRVGTLQRHDVKRAGIAAVRTSWETRAEKAKSVSNLALIAYPNVMIDLVAPMKSGRREIRSIAHRLDDLPAFLAALNHGNQR